MGPNFLLRPDPPKAMLVKATGRRYPVPMVSGYMGALMAHGVRLGSRSGSSFRTTNTSLSTTAGAWRATSASVSEVRAANETGAEGDEKEEVGKVMVISG